MDLSILRLEKMEETTIYTQLSVYAGSGVTQIFDDRTYVLEDFTVRRLHELCKSEFLVIEGLKNLSAHILLITNLKEMKENTTK